MDSSTLLKYDTIVLFIQISIALSALYSAWVNLVQKHISKVGFDAFILLFFNKRKATLIRENPRLIKRMGIITLLVSIGSTIEVISIFTQKIWPHIQ
jgi:hypothetical protein